MKFTSAALAATLLLCGCASTGTQRVKSDPWEPMNRSVYKFNDAVDRVALKPAAKAYVKVTPQPVRTGVSNFFQNLSTPTTIVNSLLQGKFAGAGQDTLRFLINTTLGWGGIFDVASGASLPIHNEDSGQTLGRWGVPAGPYLVLPFLGPASLRDAPARIADDFTRPLHWYDNGAVRWGSLALNALDTRARFLPLEDTLSQTYDPYAFIRDAYLQQRRFQVYDGNPPDEPVEEEFEDDGGP
ncbi:MAG TPA: VacJ family lipoprotein [Steroidobacteraceae bacterium]